MNYKEVPKGLSEADAMRYAEGIKAMSDLADSLGEQGKLPKQFSKFKASFLAAPAKLGIDIVSPLSAETQKLVERMEQDGYAVYKTTGRTPASLKLDGMRYWLLGDELANITAPPALLAFKKAPSEFFLPGSHNLVHDEQVKLLPEEQRKVDKRYPGAGLVVKEGKLPEWTEIALKHFKATGVRIFGRDYEHNYTWTDTYKSEKFGAGRAHFGGWYGMDGAFADLWDPGVVDPGLGLASLVEIPRK